MGQTTDVRPDGEDTDVRTATRGSRVRAELRDMWETRPARPREDRKVAGVAAAIAHRYDIDPVLVRIGFVVAGFYGPGIPLYLAGCAALPDAGTPHRPHRGRVAALTATVLVAAAAALSAMILFDGNGNWAVPLLASVGLLVALHLTRGTRTGTAAPAGQGASTEPAPLAGDTPAAVGVPPAEHAPSGAPEPGPDDTSPITVGEQQTAAHAADGRDAAPAGPPAAVASAPTAATPAPVPPSWDPLGAAPFAWDLPEPGPEPEQAPVHRSRLTPVTLAVALVGAGIAGVLALTAPGALGVAAVPATALAVVGFGLVLGAFRHTGRWLIPFALVLAAATWLAAAVPWPHLRDGVGDVTAAPTTVAGLAPDYRRGIGSVDLDLRGLDLRSPPGLAPAPVRTSASVGIGSVSIVVPRGADLVVRGDAGMGDISLDGQGRSGSAATLDVTDPGPDGPGGRPIELDLRAGIGSLEVTRD